MPLMPMSLALVSNISPQVNIIRKLALLALFLSLNLGKCVFHSVSTDLVEMSELKTHLAVSGFLCTEVSVLIQACFF